MNMFTSPCHAISTRLRYEATLTIVTMMLRRNPPSIPAAITAKTTKGQNGLLVPSVNTMIRTPNRTSSQVVNVTRRDGDMPSRCATQ